MEASQVFEMAREEPARAATDQAIESMPHANDNVPYRITKRSKTHHIRVLSSDKHQHGGSPNNSEATIT